MAKSQFASLNSDLLARKGQASPALSSQSSLAELRDAPIMPQSEPNDNGFARRDIQSRLEPGWQTAEASIAIARPPEVALTVAQPPEVALTVAQPPLPPKPKSVLEKVEACTLDCATANLVEEEPDFLVPDVSRESGRRVPRYKASVRLRKDQKRRLRIVAALFDRSHQDILSMALDDYLDGLKKDKAIGCTCLVKELDGTDG